MLSPQNQVDYSSSVPPEILTDIFRAAVSSRSLGPLPSEVVISHVCSRWRQIVAQCPYLWSHLHITSHTHHDRVAAYLERSKLCYLDISFEFSLCGEPGEYVPNIDTLERHSHRWRKLAFTSENPSLLFILPNLSHAVRLGEVSLTLHAAFHFPGPLIGPINRWLSSLPTPNCLKKINLDLLHRQEVASAQTLKALISASPSLENLSLHGCGVSMTPNIPQVLINARSLRSLSLRCAPSKNRCSKLSWLHCLEAPNLQFLELKNVSQADWPSFQEAIENGPHTYSQLRKIRLVDVEMGELGSSFANATPKLSSIDIVESGHSTRAASLLLRLLTEDAVAAVAQCHEPIWPALQYLRLSQPDSKLLDWASTSRETANRPFTFQRI